MGEVTREEKAFYQLMANFGVEPEAIKGKKGISIPKGEEEAVVKSLLSIQDNLTTIIVSVSLALAEKNEDLHVVSMCRDEIVRRIDHSITHLLDAMIDGNFHIEKKVDVK